MQLSRSVINASRDRAKRIFDAAGVSLPAWAHWPASRWEEVADDSAYDTIRDCMVGWDVTDFGSRDFFKIGRTLFTLRNGRMGDDRHPKSYAEKLILDPENQRAPAHFHRSKREDIICVAGGNILVKLTAADEENRPSDRPVRAVVDGVAREVEPGGVVRLEPGMSVTIEPRTIHQFWGEEGTGIDWGDGTLYAVSREVSSVCDDWHDNFFLTDDGQRFPEIDEDEPRQVYLCHEYPGRN